MTAHTLGAHQSIAGGIYKSLERAHALQTNALQIFTKNSNRWLGKKISEDHVQKFFLLKKKYKIKSVIAHSAYLINLASDTKNTIAKSITALSEELENCKVLNIKYLVLHPGSHKGSGETEGIKRIVENLNIVLQKYSDSNIMILLETTAGQGNSIGHKLEHLKEIREKSEFAKNIGYCIDTCHLFAAGYDFRDKKTFFALKKKFDKILDIENIKVIHFNDSKKELGSRVDRHEHIGKGKIGANAFGFFLNDDYFKKIPIIIETPKENNMDEINLSLLKKMIS